MTKLTSREQEDQDEQEVHKNSKENQDVIFIYPDINSVIDSEGWVDVVIYTSDYIK